MLIRTNEVNINSAAGASEARPITATLLSPSKSLGLIVKGLSRGFRVAFEASGALVSSVAASRSTLLLVRTVAEVDALG
jgi:hypothetical protein